MTDSFNERPLVLIVEDDEDIRRYLSALVGQYADTVEADSGDAGLALARSRMPALILLDLMMPGTDGNEVCKILKRNPETRHIPVIFITAKSDHNFEVAALKLGAIDYIVKPFDAEVVSAKVRNHLAALSAQEQRNPPARPAGRPLLYGALAVLLLGLAGGAYVAFDWLQESRQQSGAPGMPVGGAGPQAPAPVTSATPRAADEPMSTEYILEPPYPRPTEKLEWVKRARCGFVPLVRWWENVTADSIVLYVQQHHGGAWESYVAKWRQHLHSVEQTMFDGGAIRVADGSVVEGAELREFVAKLRKRVDVVECLNRAASRMNR